MNPMAKARGLQLDRLARRVRPHLVPLEGFGDLADGADSRGTACRALIDYITDRSMGAMGGWKPPFLPAPEGGGFRAAATVSGARSTSRSIPQSGLNRVADSLA